MAHRMISMLSLVAALVAAGASPTAAEEPATKGIVVSVQGLACPFCAYGIEKHLRGLEGVAEVEVDVAKSQATLTLKDPSAVTDDDIREAVGAAGFTPGEIRRPRPAAAAPEPGRRAQLRVEGMRCEYCVANLGSVLERREGVISAHVDLQAKRAVVEYDPKKVTPEEIAETIERAGKFEATVVGASGSEAE